MKLHFCLFYFFISFRSLFLLYPKIFFSSHLIFFIFLILIFNPMIDKIKKSYYDDILLILYDKTQSVVASKKINQLQNIKENIKEK